MSSEVLVRSSFSLKLILLQSVADLEFYLGGAFINTYIFLLKLNLAEEERSSEALTFTSGRERAAGIM